MDIDDMQEAWQKTKRDWSIDIFETATSWRTLKPELSFTDKARDKANWIREMEDRYGSPD